MNVLVRWYRYFNLLSIDVAAGAIAGACFFASILQVSIRPYAIASLGLTVWIIYTTDHLLDARKIKGSASTARHQFHQKNFTLLAAMMVMACLINVSLIFFIKKPVLYNGLIVSLIVGLYLLVHRRLTFLKEIVVAILYCVGILLPSLPVTSVQLLPIHYVLIFTFFNTALINLIMFSWFDLKYDLADDNKSIVTLAGSKNVLLVLWVLMLLNALLIVYGILSIDVIVYFVVVAFMNLALIIILAWRNWFVRDDRYRLLGDAVFLFPYMVLMF